MPRRPLALTVLGALQFVAFAAACVIALGEGTEDGALSGGDIARAVGVAFAGALVVGCTWSGGRVAWWFELVLGAALVAAAVATGIPALAAGGILWLGIVLLPPSREWFLRPQL